jgi:hypothetical protein
VGRGRVDTFNPYKAVQFNWNLTRLPQDELIAASDYPSLWNQRPREGMHLHWDGDNDSVDERNLSAALGAGVTPVTVDHDGIRRVREWIWTLQPPPYPYPVDMALAARGARRIVQPVSCATPTIDSGTAWSIRQPLVSARSWTSTISAPIDIGSTRTPRCLPQTSISSSPHRQYRFTHFRKTRGYANHPLDGIWLRAPYLHNGSVPTLADLLEPADRRPKVFYRGNDVFDR